jgi:DNA-binding beta-propeller fold protein YncE
MLISCEKENDSGIKSINYKSSFSTETTPIAIAIEKKQGFVYIANYNPSISNFSSKIQKFSNKGELKETIIDFETFNLGLYEKYAPLDLCIDNNDIYILVKPMSQNNDTGTTYSGFCILHYDLSGNIINEFDFSQLENNWAYSAISFSNEFIYVTSGEIVILKIDKSSGHLDYIHIPITNDKPYLLVSDMVVESEENIIITGQGPWTIESGANNDVSICHITRLDCIANKSYSFNSDSRTGTMAAMPNNPGLTIKDNRYIYVATFYGRSLEIFDIEKENKLIFQEEINSGNDDKTLPIDVAIYESNIYIVDYKNDKVYIYNEPE